MQTNNPINLISGSSKAVLFTKSWFNRIKPRTNGIQNFCFAILFLFFGHIAFSQIIVESGTTSANFGVDGDVQKNGTSFIYDANGNLLPSVNNTDDWFEDMPMAIGSGQGIIDVSTLPDVNGNTSFVLGMPPGSQFQIINNSLWLDGVFIRDPHWAGNENDFSIFKGGSNKNADSPNTWNIITGSNPQKNDIIDAMAHLRRDVTDLQNPFGGDLWAFIGASTRSADGSAYLDFELFRSEVSYDASNNELNGTGDPVTGYHTAWGFDSDGYVSSLGDMIIALNFENGGVEIIGHIYLWVNPSELPGGSLENYNALIGTGESGYNFRFVIGGNGQPVFETGDETNGYGYAEIELYDNSLNDSVAFAVMNAGDVDSGPFGTKFGPQGNNQEIYAENSFVEFGLNLTQFGLDATTLVDGDCQALFGGVLIKTRSSASFDSELKDLAGPFPFGNIQETEVEIVGEDLDCNDESTTLTAIANIPFGLEYEWYNENDPETILSITNELVVYEPGFYTIVVTAPGINGPGTGCSSSTTREVIEITPPVIVVDCPDAHEIQACSTNEYIASELSDWFDIFGFSGGQGALEIVWTANGEIIDPETYVLPSFDACTGGTVTIGISVSDECEQEESCTSTFTVLPDDTPPTIDIEAEGETVECDGDGNQAALAAWLASHGDAEASDNCTEVTWSNDFSSLSDDCGMTGSATVTFTATDECNLTATTTATFIIEDTTPPSIDVEAEDETVECDGDGNQAELAAWLASNGGAEASDICAGVSWSNDFTGLSDDCGMTGSATVTFTATDECDLTSTTTATFTIEDTTPPSIDVEAEDETVECDGDGNQAELAAWLASNGGAEASDICAGVTWSNDFTGLSDDCGMTGSATVTFTATDECDLTSTTTATFTIEDTTPPSIDVEAGDETVECDGAGNQEALAAWLASNGGASASDICAGVTWSNDFTGLSDDCGMTGSATVTFTATDECDLTSKTIATFTIEDTIPPSIDVEAGDETVECDGAGNQAALEAWLASNGGASASDICAGVTWSNDFTGLSDDCGMTGSATVTFTATDECDLTSTTSATFTIEDTTPPSIDVEAGDETVECDGAGNLDEFQAWLDSNGGATGDDVCSDVIWSNDYCANTENLRTVDTNAYWEAYMNVFNLPENGGDFQFGTGWGIQDAISIVDTEANTITLKPNRIGDPNEYWYNPDGSGNKIMDASTFVVDNTLLGLSFSFNGFVSSNTLEPSYISYAFIRVFTADYSALLEEIRVPLIDGQGFSATYNNGQPDAGNIQYGFNVSGVNVNFTPEFDDIYNALGSIVVEEARCSFTDECGETGSATITFTASDECGNSTSTTATFTIEDTQGPVIDTSVIAIDLCNEEFPETLSANWSDECSGEGTLTANGTNFVQGDCVQYQDYVFTATDDCGNSTKETVTIERYYDENGKCETAFGMDPNTSTCFLDLGVGINRWGWTNYYEEEGTYTIDLYAGAAKCGPDNGAFVGTATIEYSNGEVYVTYTMDGEGDWFNYVMNEAHVYVGCDPTPNINGAETVAPGQYTVVADDLDQVTSYIVGPIAASGPIYVIAHAVTCEVLCHCSPWNTGEFTPEDGSYDPIECELETTENVASVKSFNEFSAYPVPFNGEFNVKYNFDFNTDVTIEVFDIKGTLVKRIDNSNYLMGMNSITKIDLSQSNDQMFFVRITTSKGTMTKKVISSNVRVKN